MTHLYAYDNAYSGSRLPVQVCVWWTGEVGAHRLSFSLDRMPEVARLLLREARACTHGGCVCLRVGVVWRGNIVLSPRGRQRAPRPPNDPCVGLRKTASHPAEPHLLAIFDNILQSRTSRLQADEFGHVLATQPGKLHDATGVRVYTHKLRLLSAAIHERGQRRGEVVQHPPRVEFHVVPIVNGDGQPAPGRPHPREALPRGRAPLRPPYLFHLVVPQRGQVKRLARANVHDERRCVRK